MNTLAAIQSDPLGFLAAIEGPLVIDEVQRAPEIFLAIKSQVDRGRQPGRYLLTGSANVLLSPKLSDSFGTNLWALPISALWNL